MLKVLGKNGSATKKGTEVIINTLNLVGNGTAIRGEIDIAGDLRIDGSVSGVIRSKAKIVMGEGAHVNGDIFCQNADISGEITGNIYVEELLTLKSTARIFGDIITKKLVIDAGADFNGKCQMGDVNGTGETEQREPAREKLLREA
jgi:cytoskeletal protein CcmA (bactofilin family)